jgi:hypothetical protein
VAALRQLTWWTILGASLVVGLAALVRLSDPAGPMDDLTGVIRLPTLVTWTIVALFSLAALVYLVDVGRRLRSRRPDDEDMAGLGREPPPRQPWLQALSQVLSMVNFFVIAYLLWKNVMPLADLMSPNAGGGAGDGVLSERVPDAPFFITWTFAALALVAGGAAVALAVWLTSSDRFARWWRPDPDAEAPSPLTVAVDESREDLRAEPDARRAIMRCYARFERAAAASGLARLAWHTPMEFMTEVLASLPAPRSAVGTLTALFELARFSDRPLGAAERDRALDALDAIKATIEEGRGDADAR